MIKNVKVTNHLGEALTIDMKSPEKSGFFIRGIDGLGPSKSVVNMSESSAFDGSVFNSSRVSSKNIVFDIGFFNDSPVYTIEMIRQKSYRFFPLKKEITFQFEMDNRLVYIKGYVESNEPKIFDQNCSAQISVLCPSAFFFGLDTILTYFIGSNPSFQFPFENASLSTPLLEFGSVYSGTSRVLSYIGDEETGLIVYISFAGAVTNPTITNVNAARTQTMTVDSTKLAALTGSNIIAGDQINIVTLKGSKSITLYRGASAYNILNCLTSDSTWFTIEHGDNTFSYSAVSGGTNISVVLQHQVLYDGV